MPKYGRGLNLEFSEEVRRNEISQPFSVADVRLFARRRGWDVPESYLAVSLSNGSNENYAPTWKKYFEKISDGLYKLKN